MSKNFEFKVSSKKVPIEKWNAKEQAGSDNKCACRCQCSGVFVVCYLIFIVFATAHKSEFIGQNVDALFWAGKKEREFFSPNQSSEFKVIFARLFKWFFSWFRSFSPILFETFVFLYGSCFWFLWICCQTNHIILNSSKCESSGFFCVIFL